MRFKLILAGLLILTAMPVVAQVVPQATDSSSPLYAGIGYSRFSPDWGPGRTLDGLDAYVGIMFPHRFHIPNGFGIEAEGRDMFFNPSTNVPNYIKSEASLGGGLIYKYQHWQKFRPYGKFFYEAGRIDYPYYSLPDAYAYSTLTVMGGGLEYKVKTHYWIRADYSYERWPNLFKLGKDLNPVGVTVGMTYNFMR